MNKSESKYFNTATKMDLALISLLKKKPFEYITVSEICKVAGINRSTFYLHYETVADLLDEATKYLLNDFLSYFSQDTQTIAHHIMDCNLEDLVFVCDKYLIPYLSYIKDNKEIFYTALSHVKMFGLEDIYVRLFENIFNPILNRFNYPHDYRKFVMMYYLNGINGIINEWLKCDCKTDVDEISKIIIVCIFGLNK